VPEPFARRPAIRQFRFGLRNRIHAIVADQGHDRSAGGYWTGPGRAWLAALDLPAMSRELLEDDLGLIGAIQGRIDRLDWEIHQRARSDPRVKVLTQLPGVGPFTALVILAEVGDVSRFASARKLATCIVHLLRNSFKYASKKDWAQIAKDLKPVYTAASEAKALDRFAEFSGKWEARYPAIIKLWENAWAEFVPFLRFDQEIRTVICTTNAIESINARLRRAVNARGHFPTEQAALKCLYLAIMSLDPTGRSRQRWTNRWKAALNAFDITFDGRLSAGRK
jgi:hypothetical protein